MLRANAPSHQRNRLAEGCRTKGRSGPAGAARRREAECRRVGAVGLTNTSALVAKTQDGASATVVRPFAWASEVRAGDVQDVSSVCTPKRRSTLAAVSPARARSRTVTPMRIANS